MRQGEIYWLDFDEPEGSEPGYRRPWMVIQNDTLNESRLATTMVVAISSNTRRRDSPGHVLITSTQSGLARDSVVVCSQLVTIDKRVLEEFAGRVPEPVVMRIVREVQAIIEPASATP